MKPIINHWTRHLNQLTPAQQLAEVMGRIYHNGLTTPSGGNLSIKDQNGCVWVSPSQIDKAGLCEHDIICIHPDGHMEGPHTPTSEYPFHLKIYQNRPDIRAIVHAHPVGLVTFCVAGKLPEKALLPDLLDRKPLGFSDYALPGTIQLAEQVGNTFAKGFHSALMENHGIICTAADLANAYYAMEKLEWTSRIQLNALRLIPNLDIALPQTDEEELKPDEGLPANHQEEIESIKQYGKRALQRNLSLSSGFSWSFRAGENLIISTPTADLAMLDPEDFRIIPIHEPAANEIIKLHQNIYLNQADIQSVATFLPPHIMAFAVSDCPFNSRTIPESYLFLRDLPTLPYNTTARETAAKINPHSPLALWANRCLVVSGASLFQVFDRLEVAEFTARSIIEAGSIGGIQPMSPENLEEIIRVYINQ